MSVEHTQDGTQDVVSDRLALAASMQAEAPVAGPPEIPGYSMKELLGEGTFGRVYKAVQTRTGQSVAIKILTIGGDRGYLEREVARLAQVAEHPYVCHILDANVAHNPPYLVTPLLDRSLTSFIHRRPGLEQAATWMEQIAEALQYIHLRGLLHFDLKPANVLMDSAGNARLMDFGQARLAGRESASLGTFWYMPPEQVWLSGRRGHVKQPEPSWDIYALGATMYEILTGTQPRWTEELSQHLNAPADLHTKLETYRTGLSQTPLRPVRTLNPNVDPALARIVEKCLQINPNRRYKELGTLLTDLRARKRTAAVGATPATLLIGVGAACVASLLVGLLLGRGGGAKPGPTPAATPAAVAVAPPPVATPKPAPVVRKTPAPVARRTPKPRQTVPPPRPVAVRTVAPPPPRREPEVIVVRPPPQRYPQHRHQPPPRREPGPPPPVQPEVTAVRPAPAANPPAGAGALVDCAAVGLEATFPRGWAVSRNTIVDDTGGEVVAVDSDGRRATYVVKSLPYRSFRDGWAAALAEVRRTWAVGSEVHLKPPQAGFQARWLSVENDQAAGRCLVMLAPLDGESLRLYLFACQQPVRATASLSVLAADVFNGVNVNRQPLPLP